MELGKKAIDNVGESVGRLGATLLRGGFVDGERGSEILQPCAFRPISCEFGNTRPDAED